MLKHHHRNGAPAVAPGVAPSRRRGSRALHHPSTRSVPEVSIIPGSRLFLLPLQKVTAFVRPHTPCREPSATQTKPCIVSHRPGRGSAPPNHASSAAEIPRATLLQPYCVRGRTHSKSSRLIARQRRLRTFVAKTRLSPVCEQANGVAESELLYEGLLWTDRSLVDARTVGGGFTNSRARNTSIFSLSEANLPESYRGAALAASSTQWTQEQILNSKRKKKKLSGSFYDVSDFDLHHRSSIKNHTKSRFGTESGTPIAKESFTSGRSFGRNNRVSPSSLSHDQLVLNPEFRIGNNCTASFGTAEEFETPREKSGNKWRGTYTTSSGKPDDFRTQVGKPSNSSRSTCQSNRTSSFVNAGEAAILGDENSSQSKGNCTTSDGKADELVTHCDESRSQSRGNCTASFEKGDELETPVDKKRSQSSGNCTTSCEKGNEIGTLDDKKRSHSRSHSRTSFGQADELESLSGMKRSQPRSHSRTSFDKGDELEIQGEKRRSQSRSHSKTSFGKADEIATQCDESRSQSGSHFRASFGKGDELGTVGDEKRRKSRSHSRTSFGNADELETLGDRKRSQFRGHSRTSIDKADESETLGDKKRSQSRSHSRASFGQADELVTQCEKTRRKRKGHCRTSFGNAGELERNRSNFRRQVSLWRCKHQIRSRSPFLCSFTNKDDLPVGPLPSQLSRRLQTKVSDAHREGPGLTRL